MNHCEQSKRDYGRRDVLAAMGVTGLTAVSFPFTGPRRHADAPLSYSAAQAFRRSLSAQSIYMREIGEAMPESSYHDHPVPGIRSFAGHLLHIATGLVTMTGVLIGGTTGIDGDPTGKSKAQVLRILTEAFDRAMRAVDRVPNEALDETVPWASRLLDAPTITKRQVLAVTRDHLAHHRGQILVYLRLRGVEPPTYVGF